MGNQGEYQIKITSVADLAAVEQARAEYQRLKATLAATGGDTSGIDKQLAALDAAAVSGQAAAVRALQGWQQVRASTAKFGGDTKGIDAEIARLQATLGGSGGTGALAAGVQALGNALGSLPGGSVFTTLFSGGGAAVAALGAVAGAIGAVKHGLDQYAQRQEAVAKLDQQLANSGRLTGEYREQLQALADTFSKVSGIDDTAWLRALGKIQSKDTTANLAQNAELLKNMAARTGDVDQAATLLSRALAGSFDRLRMYGFTIDENASKTEKLKQLMEQAAKGGAGVFEARLETLTGQKQKLGTATNQLWEGIGRLAFQMGLGGGTAKRLGDAIEWLTSKLPKADPVLDATTNKTDGFSKALAQATGKSIELGEHTDDPAEGMNTTGSAADKLTEKLAKATAAIDANVAATLKMQDADLALQIAQIETREATLKEKQGGKLTPEQQRAFNQEKIDARGVAVQRKLVVQEQAAEQEIEEIERAQRQPTQQLAKAQAKQAKVDTAIVTTIAEAGLPADANLKPFEQTAALDEQLRAGQETIKGYKRDLAGLDEEIPKLSLAAGMGNQAAGVELGKLVQQRTELVAALRAMEAVTAPLAAVQLKLGDMGRESKDAAAEVDKLKEVVEKFYATEQAAYGKLGVIRVEMGTAKANTANQTTQESTKAAAEQRAVDKKALEEAIKLNEPQLKAAAPGSARQQELADKQRGMQAKKLEIELFEEVNLSRRAQMIEQAERDGFKVRNANTRPVVTPLTREETLARPTMRPVQTVTPTEAAPPPAPRPQPVRTPLATRPADNAPEDEVKAYAAAENARREQGAREQGRRTGATPGFRTLPTDSAPAILAALREEERVRAAAAPPARPAPRPRVPTPPPAPRVVESGPPPSAPSSPSSVSSQSSPPATPPPPAPPPPPPPAVLPLPVTPPTPPPPVIAAPPLPEIVVTPAAPVAPVTLPPPPAPVVNVPPPPVPTLKVAPAAETTAGEPPAVPVATAPAAELAPEFQQRLNRERPERYHAPAQPLAEDRGDLSPPLDTTSEPPAPPSVAGVLAPRAAESGVAAGVIVAGMVGEKATATATAALATYDKAQEVITKTEQVLEKVSRLAAAPGTAGEGAAAAGKAAELGSKIAGQVAIGTEAAGAASKALEVAGAAGKVAGVLKPLAPIGAVIEAGKLATDFKGETGRVEAAADKGLGPAMAEGLFSPLTTVATAIKLAAEVLALNAENARAEKKAAGGGDSLSPPPAPLVNEPAAMPPLSSGDRLTPPLGPPVPPTASGDKLSPPQVPPVNFAPVVAGLDDSAKAALAGGKAVAEAAKRVNQAAQAGNEDVLAALEALAGRYESMSARVEAIQDKLRYGPS